MENPYESPREQGAEVPLPLQKLDSEFTWGVLYAVASSFVAGALFAQSLYGHPSSAVDGCIPLLCGLNRLSRVRLAILKVKEPQ